MRWRPVVLTGVCLAVGLVTSTALPNGGATDSDGGIQISPQTLVLGGIGGDVTVHTTIPYLVSAGSVTLDGVTAASTFLDDRGELVAKFSRDSIEAIVSPGEVTLTLTLTLVDGSVVVAGSDTIMVKAR